MKVITFVKNTAKAYNEYKIALDESTVLKKLFDNAKGKYNKPLSKDYKLNLPPGKSKIEKISSKPSV